MVASSLDDVLVLYLDALDCQSTAEARSIVGICAVLDYDDGTFADRVALLSAIDELKSSGLLVESRATIEAAAGEHNVYDLTDAGHERARTLRSRFESEAVVVRNAAGEESTVALGDIDEYLPSPALPRALSRRTDDGVVHLEQTVEEEFVDRDAELATLESALDGAADGRGGSVLVVGEPGVGKTALVTEAFGEQARDRGFEVVVGQCRRDMATPYDPFRSIVSELSGGDTELFADETGTEINDPGDLELQRTALFDAVLDRITEAAGQQPLVLVVEDLHDADEPTVALFSYLAERLDTTALLVGTLREAGVEGDSLLVDLVDDWEPTPASQRYRADLGPFDRSTTRTLIEVVVGRRDIPEQFVDLVYEHTGGNALFVEGSVQGMLDDGVVDPRHGVYPDTVEEIRFPDRVESVVDHRLSTFDEAGRAILRIAALIGETVPLDLLASVTETALDVDARTRRGYVDIFEDGDLFERVDEDTVRFTSGVVRERVVDRLDEDDRRRLNAAIADVIVADSTDDPGRHATIAYHLEQANRPEDAFEHRLEAADRATSVYAHEVALENYDHALKLARDRLDADTGQEAEILQSIAEVHYLLGEYDQAERYFEYAADYVTDPEMGRRIARLRADMQSSRGRHGREAELCREAIETYGTADTLESCLLYGRLSGACLADEDSVIEAAEEACQQCWEIAQRIDDPTGIAAACLNFAALDNLRGTTDAETLDRLERGLDAAEDCGDDRTLARALNNLGLVRLELLDFEGAKRAQERCIEVQRRIGDAATIAESQVNLAIIHIESGAPDEAMAIVGESLATAWRLGFDWHVSRAFVLLAELLYITGDLDAAADHLDRAEAAAPETELQLVGNIAYLRGRLLLDRGDAAEAAQVGSEQCDALAETSFDIQWSALAVLQGDARRELGEYEAAIELYERVLDRLDAKGFTAETMRTLARCGRARCAIERGDRETAQSVLDRALAAIEGYPPRTEASIRVHIELGVLARESDTPDAAADHLGTALDGAREAGWAIHEWMVLSELGHLDDDLDGVVSGWEARQEALVAATEAGVERIAQRCRDSE